MDITVLEKTAAARILIFLHKRKGWMTIYSDIQKNVKVSPPTIYRTLYFLSKAELIEEETPRAYPKKRVIKLTPLGEKVAGKLVEIEKL